MAALSLEEAIESALESFPNIDFLSLFSIFIFLFPSSRSSRSCRAPREISRSPRLAHKEPVMQTKSDLVFLRSF